MLSEKRDPGLDHPLMQDVLESIPIGVMILDSEGRILCMSARQEEISQVSREKVVVSFFSRGLS